MSEDGKPQVKMIPETDLIAFKTASKNRESKLKEEVDTLNGRVKELESEVEIAKASAEGDEDVAKVRAYLTQQSKDFEKKVKDHDKKVAEISTREKKARARELVAEYKEQGVSLTVDDLLDAEDMEKLALSKHRDYLAEEFKKKSEKPPENTKPEAGKQIYETGSAGTRTRQPKDMTNEEFATWVKAERDKALAR